MILWCRTILDLDIASDFVYNKDMYRDLFMGSIYQLGLNLVYVFISLVLGILAIKLIDKILLPLIDLEEEIQKGNLAAAIFTSTILIFVAIMIAATLN